MKIFNSYEFYNENNSVGTNSGKLKNEWTEIRIH